MQYQRSLELQAGAKPVDKRRRVSQGFRDLLALPCVVSMSLPNGGTFTAEQPALLEQTPASTKEASCEQH